MREDDSCKAGLTEDRHQSSLRLATSCVARQTVLCMYLPAPIPEDFYTALCQQIFAFAVDSPLFFAPGAGTASVLRTACFTLAKACLRPGVIVTPLFELSHRSTVSVVSAGTSRHQSPAGTTAISRRAYLGVERSVAAASSC